MTSFKFQYHGGNDNRRLFQRPLDVSGLGLLIWKQSIQNLKILRHSWRVSTDDVVEEHDVLKVECFP